MATLAPQTVYTKTAKGILEIRNKATRLPRDVAAVLESVDGAASVGDLQERAHLNTPQLHHALATLVTDGYIKAVVSPANETAQRDAAAVQFDSPAAGTQLNLEIAAHALASAEAAKVAQQEGRAALEARLRAEAEGRARSIAETRLTAESQARAAADAAARAAQHARDSADQAAAASTDPTARAEGQAAARAAATAALRARAEAQARTEAEERARAVVDEKKAAEERAREEADFHAQAERRAQERAAAETRARDALQAQLDAAAAARDSDDAESRARLLEREAEAERARADAELAARAQGVAPDEASPDLHFDDLAQKLTARVHAERRARDEASRKERDVSEGARAAGQSRDGFPPLEFAAPRVESAAPPQARTNADETLPAIDVASSAGRGDIKHVTPDHVPSALERAMMEREARAEAENKAGAVAAPPAPQPAAAAARPGLAHGAGGGTFRAAPPTFEPIRELAPAADKSGAASDVTLEEDEPIDERLNVDRTAHDILAESAEAQRKREAMALGQQAADLRRQRRDEEARREAFAERERRRRKLGRAIVAAAFGIPALVIAALQFVPLNGYAPDAQAALSARLNQPASVSTVRYVLLPTPRVVLEGVRIGAAQGVRIDRIDADAWPTALISGPMEFDTVELHGVTIDTGMLAALPAWTGGRSASTVHASRLKLYDVKLGGPDAKLDNMNGEIVFAPNGTVKHAVFDNEKMKLELEPQQSGVHVALNARDFRAPFGPAVTFSFITLEGIADKSRFATTRLEGRIGGGTVTGTLAARWDGVTIVGGELKVQGVRIDEAVQQLAPNFRAKGVLTANLRYATQAENASGFMEHAMLDGTFSLARGEIGGVDLARSVQLPGTPAGGRTAFGEIKGFVQISGNHFNYRNLRLTSGPLEATGHVDVAPDGRIIGRVDAQMSSHSAVVARSAFTVKGTVKEPQLTR